MYKIISLSLLLIFGQSYSSEYLSIITKENNKYNVGDLETPPTEPENMKWMPINDIDFSNYYPRYQDASSSAQAMYKFNTSSEFWEGDSLGYPAFDENYDELNLVGCNSFNANGYCSVSNLGSAYYNKSYDSGIYYLEIKISGSPNADIVGFSTSSTQTMTGVLFGSNSTYNSLIIRKNNNTTWVKWHDSEYFENGDVVQMWINYDDDKILIKKLGVDDNEYNY